LELKLFETHCKKYVQDAIEIVEKIVSEL
jgi:hypothetical protein